MSTFFAYEVDNRFAPLWAPFGLRPSKDGVTLTDNGLLVAMFGFLRLQTPLGRAAADHMNAGRGPPLGPVRASSTTASRSARTAGRASAFISGRRSAPPLQVGGIRR